MNKEEKKEFKRIKNKVKQTWLDNDDIKFLVNSIEKLQKENEDLKAKLEYKQYGDLDNTEFEKYINDIVETKTKELKEQLEEEQELNKIIKETRINKVLENNIEVKKLREENEELKADNYEANNIIKDLLDNIPVQKVKDKIEKYKNMCISNAKGYENYFKNNYDELVFRRMEQLEKELLEKEE